MATKQTILVVDDEVTVREVVRRYLEREGFRVVEADSGPLALHLLHEERPDLMVLDVMLPGIDGFTITRSLREPVESGGGARVGGDTPIIMLTARTDETDRIAGFELGTDDYVTKPFSPRELVMRVKAILRRGVNSHVATGDVLVVGDVQIDASSHTVTKAGQELSLPAKEFELLWFLAQHPRQVFNRAQLLDQVWGYDFYGDESTVTVHIRRLREKIESDPANPVFIQTVWGVGYRFDGPT